MKEKTLAILKPDSVNRDLIGAIISYIEKTGQMKIIGMKMMHLSKDICEKFYAVHNGRPFFEDLVNFMSSGPVVILALSGENVISSYRELMGATDPKEAKKGSIRGDFADDISANCVHGSDSPENAKRELEFFFASYEMFD